MVKIKRLAFLLLIILGLALTNGCGDQNAEWEAAQKLKIETFLLDAKGVDEFSEVIVSKKDSSISISGIKGRLGIDAYKDQALLDLDYSLDKLVIKKANFEPEAGVSLLAGEVELYGLKYNYTQNNFVKEVWENSIGEYFFKDVKGKFGFFQKIVSTGRFILNEDLERDNFYAAKSIIKDSSSRTTSYMTEVGARENDLLEVRVSSSIINDIYLDKCGHGMVKDLKALGDDKVFLYADEVSFDSMEVGDAKKMLLDLYLNDEFDLRSGFDMKGIKVKNTEISDPYNPEGTVRFKDLELDFKIDNETLSLHFDLGGVELTSSAMSSLSRNIFGGIDITRFYNEPISFALGADFEGSFKNQTVSMDLSRLEFREEKLGGFLASVKTKAFATEIDEHFFLSLILAGSLEKASLKFEDRGIVDLGMQVFAVAQGLTDDQLKDAGATFRSLSYFTVMEQCSQLRGVALDICNDVAAISKNQGVFELSINPGSPVGMNILSEALGNLDASAEILGIKSSYKEK